jgi:flagellar basal-body rod modification protein FlgD
MTVTSATTPTTTPTTPSSTTGGTGSTSNVIGQSTIAGNFNTFLQLLTTQLKNQNPLDPLDTNQFTQQLVQFAQVEQQLNMNTSLSTMIALQQSSQATSAVSLLGQTVTVGGNTSTMNNGKAAWTFSSPSTGTATINIADSTGATVYSGTTPIQTGAQTYTWNGVGTNGTQYSSGNYTISITAKDANGQPITTSTDATGTVDSIDVSQNPPILTIGGQTYPLNQIKQVTRNSIL